MYKQTKQGKKGMQEAVKNLVMYVAKHSGGFTYTIDGETEKFTEAHCKIFWGGGDYMPSEVIAARKGFFTVVTKAIRSGADKIGDIDDLQNRLRKLVSCIPAAFINHDFIGDGDYHKVESAVMARYKIDGRDAYFVVVDGQLKAQDATNAIWGTYMVSSSVQPIDYAEKEWYDLPLHYFMKKMPC